tara:strand:+ start:17 stop:1036 length:1020 start_codon:yes stop_codon:yes gene_type:complete
MKRVFGYRQKECPKHNALYQGYLNPKLSRRERQNQDLTDYWVTINTKKDIEQISLNDGSKDMIGYNIKKLNGDFNNSPKIGSGVYLYVMTKKYEINLIKIYNINDLNEFKVYYRDAMPPIWRGSSILYNKKRGEDVSEEGEGNILTGHTSYFTPERYQETLDIEERAISESSDPENYRDDPKYKRITSDCDILFGGELWYYQPSVDTEWGLVMIWNNGTGHYQPSSESPNKQLTGLPDDLYVGLDWHINESRSVGLKLIDNFINFFSDTGEMGAKKISKKVKKKLNKSKTKLKTKKMKKHKLYPNNIDKYVQSMHGSKSIKKSKKKSKKKLKKKSKSKK